MGCSQSTEAVEPEEDDILKVMFKRFDRDRSGFITRPNLQKMMNDDNTYFKGKDVDHILTKYGADAKLSFEQFSVWWGSTYTTYNDDEGTLQRMVDEVHQESSNSYHLPPITELEEQLVQHELAPHNSNVAVSRS
jgi:hypothetical protein